MKQVFESLGLKFREISDSYYGCEFSDVHYLLSHQDGGKYQLRVVIGEGFPGKNFVPRKQYLQKERWTIVMGFLFIFFFWPYPFYISPLGLLIFAGMIGALIVPGFKEMKAKRTVIPSLQKAGLKVVYGGCVQVVENTFDPIGGHNVG